MKKCRYCLACAKRIDLNNRNNIRVKKIEHGYKENVEYQYYSYCPYCSDRHPLKLKDIPLLIRWKLFKEGFL